MGAAEAAGMGAEEGAVAATAVVVAADTSAAAGVAVDILGVAVEDTLLVAVGTPAAEVDSAVAMPGAARSAAGIQWVAVVIP